MIRKGSDAFSSSSRPTLLTSWPESDPQLVNPVSGSFPTTVSSGGRELPLLLLPQAQQKSTGLSDTPTSTKPPTHFSCKLNGASGGYLLRARSEAHCRPLELHGAFGGAGALAVCLFYDALWSLSVALLSYTCLLPFSRLITGSTLWSGGLA